MFNGGIIGLKNEPAPALASGVWTIKDQFVSIRADEWPGIYIPMTFTGSGGITISRNGTTNVDLAKTGGTDSSWDQGAHTAAVYSQPLTIEFNKTTAASGDDGLSYAMIGFNADPATNNSYDTIDYASYPYAQAVYEVYHNGSYIVPPVRNFNQANKFYVVYADNVIKHYNGSTLLYTSPAYTANPVGIDSAFYKVNQANNRFTNVRLTKKIWNGTQYV
jgi:hypothetical protein